MEKNCKDGTLVSIAENYDKKCGAKAKSTGKPCKRIPLPNGRCKFHGGRCTGPKTKAGKKRSSQNNLKDGKHTDAKVRATAALTKFMKLLKFNTREALILMNEKPNKKDIKKVHKKGD